jgi:alkanesulfonate monooxygenase
LGFHGEQLEIVGMIGTRLASEMIPPRGPILDPSYVRDFTRVHEEGGFDRVLVGYYSNQPDGFLVAQHADVLVRAPVALVVS